MRAIGGSSGSESRVVPTVTIQAKDAWLVPVDGSATRPWGGRTAPVPPHAEFKLSHIGLPFGG